jgi:hypothetical protein
MFAPRKSAAVFTAVNAALNILHNFSPGHELPARSQAAAAAGVDSSPITVQPFKPAAGATAHLIASTRSHFSTRPSSFLASPSTLAVPSYAESRRGKLHLEPQFAPASSQQISRAVNLKDSYSRDAEMWGEYVTPRAPSVPFPDIPMHSHPNPAPQMLHSTINVFDQVSPAGDVIQSPTASAGFSQSKPVQELQPSSARHEIPNEKKMRSPSPETIAIQEAMAVRILYV